MFTLGSLDEKRRSLSDARLDVHLGSSEHERRSLSDARLDFHLGSSEHKRRSLSDACLVVCKVDMLDLGGSTTSLTRPSVTSVLFAFAFDARSFGLDGRIRVGWFCLDLETF